MHSLARVVLVCAAVAVSAAVSAADPVDLIKFRQNVMKVNGALMANAGAIITGKIDDKARLPSIAKALEDNVKGLGPYFAKGTESGADTKALPAIWEKSAEFGKKYQDLLDKTSAFAKVASSSDMTQVAAAHKAVNDACRACHADFRKQQQ